MQIDLYKASNHKDLVTSFLHLLLAELVIPFRKAEVLEELPVHSVLARMPVRFRLFDSISTKKLKY